MAILRPLTQILVPYYLIVGAYAAVWGEVPWASIFLVGNFGFADPETRGMVPYLYWFIEAYCQMMLVFVALFAIPRFRQLAARQPFAMGMLLLGVALIARLALPVLWPIGNRQIFTLPWIFYLAVIGWCAAIAETRLQRLLLVASRSWRLPVFRPLRGRLDRHEDQVSAVDRRARCSGLRARASASRAGRRSWCCRCRLPASISTSCTVSCRSC